MTNFAENERLTCRSPEELDKALAGNTSLIKSLHCDRITEAELVARVSEFKNLQSCHLSLCDASQLSKKLGELTKLTYLSLQASRLTEFPILLADATNLTTLSLGNNGIETIPDEVRQLKNVTDLSLMQNRLKSIPDSLFELPLKYLNLSYNELELIPDAISNMTELESLTLAANRLTKLPGSIGNLSQLDTLSLDYNKLDSLPTEILNIQNLQYLSVTSNRFKSLPDGLETFSKSIKTFKIDGKHRPLFMDWAYQHSEQPTQFELSELELYLDDLAPEYSEISRRLEEAGAGEWKTKIRKSISIKSAVADDYSQLGCSRMGGFPDLVDETQLPRTDEGIWIYLFQLNLADIAELNQYLPRAGLLSFFVKSLEDFQCKVTYLPENSELKTIRFDPNELIDDQDDYTDRPFRVVFSNSTSIPYLVHEGIDLAKFEPIHNELETAGNHCLNAYTYTQHESPETQAANQLGGTPNEWVPLLKLGHDMKVGFCFWDAGTLTFTIHQEDLRRHDFSNVVVTLESS